MRLKSLKLQNIYRSTPYLWTNGSWWPAPVPDLNSQRAFTSMRVRGGHIEFWKDHLERLAHGQKLSDETCYLIQTLAQDLEWSALRLEIKQDQSIEILRRDLAISQNIAQHQKSVRLKPVQLDRPRLVAGSIKLAQYGTVLKDLESVTAEGYDDLVYVVNDEVFEASFSNIFLVTEDQNIIAPRARLGILEGIMLKNFLASAQSCGYLTARQDIQYEHLQRAKFIGLTNCLRGIRLAGLEEKSYDDEKFFQRWIQPIVERMYEEDRRQVPAL